MNQKTTTKQFFPIYITSSKKTPMSKMLSVLSSRLLSVSTFSHLFPHNVLSQNTAVCIYVYNKDDNRD